MELSATYYAIALVLSIVCAVACYFIARSKGRGVVLWPVLGFIFGIIPLIIVAVLPRKTS